MSTFISLKNAYVRYPVFTSSKQQSLLTAIASSASFGRIGHATDGIQLVESLRNVSIHLNEGTKVGIIGRNGSGKSTLLKALAGICPPVSGQRYLEGHVSTVLSIGSGLDHEKTGRENVNYVATIFGYNESQIEEIIDGIVEFADLGQFFEMPIRTYSSGMMVRLSFAIATALRGDILLVDEVLSAGDMHFLERASHRFKERLKTAKVLALATHSEMALTEFCDDAIWMEAGRIIDYGDPHEVWNNYTKQIARFPSGVKEALTFPLNRNNNNKTR